MQSDTVYEFGEFRLDTRRHVLLSGADAQPLPLTSKAFETLAYLVKHRDQVVEKAVLMQAVWPNVIVEENNLNQVITALRRVFGERRGEHRFIVTVPGRGYRFVAEVRAQAASAHSAPSAALSEVASGTAQSRPPSIAVLPFANLTGEPDKEYFGDGMAEELIHMLTRVPGLRVPARTSSFAYKERNVHIREIARDLNVATVLEGSVRSAGERIRVTAQLVDAESGFHRWSQTFERRFEDIFKLQDELATAIVAAVNGAPEAGRPAMSFAPVAPTRDIEAYHLFLQGSALMGRVSEANYARAAQLFSQAIARDPNFARALCGEGAARIGIASYFGSGSLVAAVAKCEERARQALAVDPGLAEAEALLGTVAAHRLQWSQAQTHFQRSFGLGADGMPRIYYAFDVAASTGHLEQGRRAVERAFEMAPGHPHVAVIVSTFHSFEGRDAEALRVGAIAEALGWPTDQAPLTMLRSQAARRAGRYAEAGEFMKQSFREPARRGGMNALVDVVYRALADAALRPAALGAIRALVASHAEQVVAARSQPMLLMHWAVALGDIDLAFHIGELALDRFEREQSLPLSSFLPQLWLPEMRAFRRDPRFHAFAAERLKLLDYWKEYGPPDGHELREGRLVCQ